MDICNICNIVRERAIHAGFRDFCPKSRITFMELFFRKKIIYIKVMAKNGQNQRKQACYLPLSAFLRVFAVDKKAENRLVTCLFICPLPFLLVISLLVRSFLPVD